MQLPVLTSQTPEPDVLQSMSGQFGACWHAPVGSQVSVVHAIPSSHEIAVCTQPPASVGSQVSVVHALLSSQFFADSVHTDVPLQVRVVHPSEAQVTEVPPHTPPLHWSL